MSRSKRTKVRIALIATGFLLAGLVAAALLHPFGFRTVSGRAPGHVKAPQETSSADKPAPRAASPDIVLARVGGQPIFAKDLALPPAEKAFGVDVSRVQDELLERKIHLLSVRQFLDSNHISVPDEEVERAVAELRKTPPSLGCPCCRYASLDQFMEDNYLTLVDLRMMLRNNRGLKQYAQALWEKEYPEGPKRTQLLEKEREERERRYVRVRQIFFNTFQQPGFAEAPDRIRAEAQKKAVAAVARLQKGEPFQSVAKDVSEDVTSRADGGDLGCIPKDAFGMEFTAAVADLKPGQRSAPVESPWGVHIILREAMTQEDLLDIVRNDHINSAVQDAAMNAQTAAKIERLSPDAPAQ